MLKLRAAGLPLEVGRDFALGGGAVFATRGPLRFGDRVHIGRDFHCEVALQVGDDVLISSRVAVVGNDHDFSDPTTTVFCGRRLPQSEVVLEGDNLLGFGSVVVGNIRIGRGTVVGAGSLVTRDLPAWTVCVGRPAKPVRNRHLAPRLG